MDAVGSEVLAYRSGGRKYHRMAADGTAACSRLTIRDDAHSVPLCLTFATERCRVCWAYYNNFTDTAPRPVAAVVDLGLGVENRKES